MTARPITSLDPMLEGIQPSRRIILVAKYFWPEKIGSAPYMADLAAWLAAQGHEVEVVTARPHYTETAGFERWRSGAHDRETYEGAAVARVPANLARGNGLLGRLVCDLRFALGARRLLKARIGASADTRVICLTPTILSLLMVHWTLRRYPALRDSVVVITHDIESGLAGKLRIAASALLVAPMRWIERLALNRAAKVFVLSQAMKRELLALGVREQGIHLMPIWTNAASKAAPADPARPQAEGLTVMYSGSLGKKQGLDSLLELAQVMAEELPQARLRIQGEGPEKAGLLAQARRMGLDNVDFLPLAPASEFLGSLQAADIHVVPQAGAIAGYAVPSKLFNIMAAGKTVLAICEPDSTVAEIVTRADAGLCVPRNSQPALRAALLLLAHDAERRRRHGESGQRYVRTAHDSQAIFTDFARQALSPSPTHS